MPRRPPPQLPLQFVQTRLSSAHAEINLHRPSPLLPPPLDQFLTDIGEPASPAETHFHQRVDVQHAARARLHDLENFHRVVDGQDLALGGLEDGECDAEECLGAFEEQAVPDAEDRFDGEGADEEGHEPCSCGEADGWKADRLRRVLCCYAATSALVVELGPNGGEGVFDARHQHGNVDVSAFEGYAVGSWEVGAGDHGE